VILATRQGNLERRLFEASALIPAPGSRMALSRHALRAQQIGVAAVACAVELLSEQIGSFVMRVYEGDAEKRRRCSTRRKPAVPGAGRGIGRHELRPLGRHDRLARARAGAFLWKTR
jgi:hypothetical protein